MFLPPSLPPVQVIKTSKKQEIKGGESEIVDRSFSASSSSPLNNYSSSPPTSRGLGLSLLRLLLSRRKKSNGRKRGGNENENRKERRDADLEAFTTTRAFPIVILSPWLSHSPLSRSLAAVVEIAWANERLYWPVHNDIRGYVARCSATISRGGNRRLLGTLGETNEMFFFFSWIELIEIIIQVKV